MRNRCVHIAESKRISVLLPNHYHTAKSPHRPLNAWHVAVAPGCCIVAAWRTHHMYTICDMSAEVRCMPDNFAIYTLVDAYVFFNVCSLAPYPRNHDTKVSKMATEYNMEHHHTIPFSDKLFFLFCTYCTDTEDTDGISRQNEFISSIVTY